MNNKISKFYEEIKGSLVEREVESVYNKGINLYFPNSQITHPFACDGFLDTKTNNGKILKLIIEYKLNEILNSKIGRAKVLIQALFYMKQFELNGLILPNVCMVGDIDECFVIHTNSLLKYLDEDVDWSIAPSSAHIVYPDFVLKIANDEAINPFIFHIDENFSFKDVAQKISDLAENIQRYVHVTEHNIATIYDYFCRSVVKNIKKIKSHDLVSIFIGVITNGDEYYQHPNKKNILITPMGNIDINGDGFKSFFSHFQRTYTPQEKNNITAIADRLIEDTDRRNSGDFWTPTLFVDYAHKMISEQLGENWKDEYVVWDNCCGGKNLTRDYRFKELYCSTLFESELQIGERYNKEATSFQFDFLNDDLSKLPQGLIEAFEQNKPMVFFMNPPYATSATFTGEKQKENGCCDNIIAECMRKDNMDLAARNLIPQFLYRIIMIKEKYNLTNTHICMFCNPNFECANSFTNFRKKYFDNFKYNNGILFCASEFADCSDKWGIAFEIWNCGIQNENNRHNFIHTIVENKQGEIKEIGTKGVYNCDSLQNTSEWIRDISVSKTKIDMPIMSSGIVQFQNNKDKKIGQLTDDALGCYYHVASDIYHSATYVALFTGNCSHPSGKWSITSDNFKRIMPTFSARKLIKGEWFNDKDVFLAPNENHEKFNEFVNDSVIYSLFHSSSNQSSLRQVEYKGKKWDIKNEFFWMSKNDIINLANEYGLDEVYQDACTSNERYVYNYIQEHKNEFSKEALEVLNKAIDLTIKSFKYRQLFAEEHPEYHLDKAWDCGYYQLKAIWKEYMKEEFEQFKQLYKVLSDKMRPMVYELGFLK